jgi:tellurite resistance protein TehA-like permease
VTDAVARAGGAVVMGTGIVSVALSIDDREVLTRVLFAVAAAALAAVAVAVVALAARARARLAQHACAPAALTWIAGSGVVGARLSLLGWQREADALLAVAAGLWVLLVPRAAWRRRGPSVGLTFLLAVATESVAVLCARVALAEGAHWLAVAALAFCTAGLALYALVLVRFDLHELAVGRGDHWIAGGALAISALASARCAQALGGIGLRDLALAVWAAAAAWLPVLVVAELVHRRRTFDERRWSTVFPLGMYAACSFAAGDVARVTPIVGFARVWVWVALASWVAVAARTARELA